MSRSPIVHGHFMLNFYERINDDDDDDDDDDSVESLQTNRESLEEELSLYIIMPASIAGILSGDARLTYVCLFVCLTSVCRVHRT